MEIIAGGAFKLQKMYMQNNDRLRNKPISSMIYAVEVKYIPNKLCFDKN